MIRTSSYDELIKGIKCRFRIKQRQNYHKLSDSNLTSYEGIMGIIASYFNGNLTSIVRARGEIITISFLISRSNRSANAPLESCF